MKTWALEKINKNLLLLALAALMFKKSSFAASGIPNPFEVLFVLVFLLTVVYVIKNKKIKEFWESIPKKVWIALICLVFSVLFGWLIAIVFKDLRPNFNNLLEFGGFAIGLAIFFLVLFYTKDDNLYFKRCLCALLLPAVYIFAILPSTALYFNLATDITFLGFTTNPNIISKILLVPTTSFIVFALFERENKWYKAGYFLVASILVSLVIWTGSRGALFSLATTSLVIYLIFILHKFKWQKIFAGGAIILAILLCGYLIAPASAKTGIVARNFSEIKISLTKNLILGKELPQFTPEGIPLIPETRLTIWPAYISEILKNPLGVGPNTHMRIFSSTGRPLELGPHNTYMAIWFWGGWIGLISFLYILVCAFKNLRNRLKQEFDTITVAILGALVALSVSIAFNDSLQFFWFWVILALASRK